MEYANKLIKEYTYPAKGQGVNYKQYSSLYDKYCISVDEYNDIIKNVSTYSKLELLNNIYQFYDGIRLSWRVYNTKYPNWYYYKIEPYTNHLRELYEILITLIPEKECILEDYNQKHKFRLVYEFKYIFSDTSSAIIYKGKKYYAFNRSDFDEDEWIDMHFI